MSFNINSAHIYARSNVLNVDRCSLLRINKNEF
jgi:hypothetical protein